MKINELVLLFPILFMFHDLEEIIMMRYWIEKNRKLLYEKAPRLAKQDNSVESFTIAVAEEFLIILAICFTAISFSWYLLWIGVFLAFTFHLFIHIALSIKLKKYNPSLITSILCIPACIAVIVKVLKITHYSPANLVMISIVSIVIMYLNLALIHKLMDLIDRKVDFK